VQRPVEKIADGSVVITDYLMEKSKGILDVIESQPFAHFSIGGPPGSGKMALLQIVR